MKCEICGNYPQRNLTMSQTLTIDTCIDCLDEADTLVVKYRARLHRVQQEFHKEIVELYKKRRKK